jgi:hypothetical protein
VLLVEAVPLPAVTPVEAPTRVVPLVVVAELLVPVDTVPLTLPPEVVPELRVVVPLNEAPVIVPDALVELPPETAVAPPDVAAVLLLTTTVYAPGGKVAMNAASRPPATSENAPALTKSAGVASWVVNVAPLDSVPVANPLVDVLEPDPVVSTPAPVLPVVPVLVVVELVPVEDVPLVVPVEVVPPEFVPPLLPDEVIGSNVPQSSLVAISCVPR